jgi:hypothetical protein
MDTFDAAMHSLSSMSQQMKLLLEGCEKALIEAATSEGLLPLPPQGPTRAVLGAGRRFQRFRNPRLRRQAR